VEAGVRREALIQIVDRLCAELGYGAHQTEPSRDPSSLHRNAEEPWGPLSPEDESLIAAIRQSLAGIASAIWATRSEDALPRTVAAALDGAELAMRGELVSGNAAQLPALMPSFVFLVTLPIVEQDEALELSRRTAELIERQLGGE
jgi:hypothetical protein